MALLSVIRRWHFREKIPIRTIAKRTGLSRNTVKKYLATDIVEPRYPKRQSPSKLDNYEQTLVSWLHRESSRNRKQRRNIKELYGDLVQLGYTGSYDRVAAFTREWRIAQQEAARTASRNTFVPLIFKPGEAFQFDWGEDTVVINGHRTKLQVAHFKLSYSRAFVLRAYLTQGHEMLFDAHEHCLTALGGIPERGIYDNMKTAVDKVGRGKERIVNKRFQAMISHYLFDADFCNLAAGWEKGQIEKTVRDARHQILHKAPAFASLEELNAWLLGRCQELWQVQRHPDDRQRTVYEMWTEEREHLMTMPTAFDGFIEQHKKVSSTCLISFEQNRYSVPASFANRVVSLRIYADRLVVVAEANVISVHQRVFNRERRPPGKTIYDWRHYLAVVQRKPGSLRNGAPFAALPPCFKRLQSLLLKRPGGDREMADVLALVLLHDEKLVEQAVEMSLQNGHASKLHVMNCLSQLIQLPVPALLNPPPTLTLATEPVANTQRYDNLRGGYHAH